MCTRHPAEGMRRMQRGLQNWYWRLVGDGVGFCLSCTAGLVGLSIMSLSPSQPIFFLPDALAYPYDICYPNYIYFPGIDRHTLELGCPLANHTGLCSCVLISRKGLFGIRELKSPFRV